MLPGFTAERSLDPHLIDYEGSLSRSPHHNRIILADTGPPPNPGPPFRPAENYMECLVECILAGGNPAECAEFCALAFPDTAYPSVKQPPAESGPGFLGWPGWGAIAATATATLVGIGLGTLLGYEIEKHGLFAPKLPRAATSSSGCVPVGPNTQHQVTVTTHWGCARADGLAKIAAEDDCKTRIGRCTGTCPSGKPCAPYAHVWNTVSSPAGNPFSALWTGCGATAYYTCKCGC
jgi:hypothetical protein